MSQNDTYASREEFRLGRGTRIAAVHCHQLPVMQSQWGMYWAALADYSPQYRDVGWSHCYDVLATFGGCGQRWIGGHWRKMTAGSVYTGPPEHWMGVRGVRGQRWQVAIVLYAADCEAPVVAGMESGTVERADAEPLRSAIQGLHREFMNRADPAVLEAWLALVDVQAKRLIHRPQMPKRLADLWQEVDAALDEAWTVEKMAQVADLSERHLWLLCRRETGTSPMRHVTRLRMARAAALLPAGHSVEAVAHQVGYEDAFGFSKAFKRYHGVSPSGFRQARRAD